MNNLTTCQWQMAHPSSIWRTAYVSAIFETDPGKMALPISDARAAITERLNSPIEISRLEHESIEAAGQRLGTLKAEPVDVVRSAPTIDRATPH